MDTLYKPHKDNVPGSFYVCDGCCTACDVPRSEAPDLFAYDKENHCYVSQQPKTADEVSRMIRALIGSELECIRYRGVDEEILRRLADSGNAQLSDTKIAPSRPVYRNHVTFDAVDNKDRILAPHNLATEFQKALLTRNSEYVKYKFDRFHSEGNFTKFSYSWYEDNFHSVEISSIESSHRRWLIVTDTPYVIHDWLADDDRFCDIRWYTEEQWNSNKRWQETPW